MSSESNFSFTTKVGGDLFTVRGDSFDEFVKHLVGAGAVPTISNLLAVLDGAAPAPSHEAAVSAIGAALGGSTIDDPFGGSFNPVTPPAGASAGDRTCSHGVMVKRTGVGQKGEWRAWFCPTPKDTPGQCKPQFADRKNPAEWNAF